MGAVGLAERASSDRPPGPCAHAACRPSEPPRDAAAAPLPPDVALPPVWSRADSVRGPRLSTPWRSSIRRRALAAGNEVVRLRAENTRLLRLLELNPHQARPPGADRRPRRRTGTRERR